MEYPEQPVRLSQASQGPLMRWLRWLALYPLFAALGLSAVGVAVAWYVLGLSLPQLAGEAELAPLAAPVAISSDQFGVPAIQAENRLDAIRALGFVTARDRLFQMDLLRRKSAGRLSELFGTMTVAADTQARRYGYVHVAEAELGKLPPEHRQYLSAYAEGVNAFISQAKALPFEFTLLNYRPEPWQATDSLLVVLGMSEVLAEGMEAEERMLTVMDRTLPADVLAFLTPDTDRFTDSLYGSKPSWRPAQAIPVTSLEKLLAQANGAQALASAITLREFVVGSNAWAVSGQKTQDGRALLANDMHLPLSVPNIWYRAEINDGHLHSAGFILPGTPLMVTGSNGHIAWGNTNLTGDFLDLVSLEINPDNPEQYKMGGHWQNFGHRKEWLKVKDAPGQPLDIVTTSWGPLATAPLLGQAVAIHWTALDEDAVNVGLFDVQQAKTLAAALDSVNHIGGPQLNVLLADDHGHIAWTITGKLPKRVGMDGSISRPWTVGKVGWDGYVDEHQLPRELDPADGILVSANDRRLGKDYPYVIGHQFVPGFRAYQISQRLKQMQEPDEWGLFNLQLDTEMAFYRFYQHLALSLLTPQAIAEQPSLQELRAYLWAWNGRADTDSLGFALLQQFRRQLAHTVITPFLAACKKADQNFAYSWLYVDTPLQALLTAKNPRLMPDPAHYKNWDAFILAQLTQSGQQLKAKLPDTRLAELPWGKLNKAQFAHPIFGTIPLLGQWLNMPEDELAGCGGCVRATSPHFGASERLVVSPAHLDAGLLNMPGGQSAHPLSPNYRDQQSYWVQGLPTPLLAGAGQNKLLLKPGAGQAPKPVNP